LAFFGAQAAHEDDPERAVLAALAMQAVFQAQLAELAQRVQLVQSAECQTGRDAPDDAGLRVGVHTGEAVVAVVEGDGNQRERRAVMGDAVSSVNHVLALAPPGEVRVGAVTHRLVQPLFEWGPGEKSHRPLRHKALLDKGRGIEGLKSPLVGRDAEMRALQEAVARLRDGIGGIVTVVGEAGIGKSRLVAEVRNTQYEIRSTEYGTHSTEHATQNAEIAIGNTRWVEGRCLSYGETMAYLPWMGVLHALLGVTADDTPAAVGRALRQEVHTLCADRFEATYAYLGRLLSVPLDAQAETIVAHADAEDLQGGTFYAVELLIERAAARQPLVVVCEDLHWADPTSLALLERLLPLTDRDPALFICVFRPEKDHGCWRIREAAERRYGHRHTHLSLDPLTGQESAELVGHLLHVENLPRAVRAHILEHAEGNPFYVEEILRALIDEGTISYDKTTDSWFATRDAVDISVPDTLYGVLRARIDQLPAGARHVLQLASVVGRVFSRRLLADIAQRDELGAHLVTLQQTQMIRERSRVPEAEYIFKHQLTLEAAYDSLLHRARRTLHRRVADALVRLYPERMEEQPGLLAHHWERAGESARAVDCLRRAGERAEAQYAAAEAFSYYDRALTLVPKTDLAAQYDLLMARSRGYRRADTQAADIDLAALEHLAEALADPYKKAEVMLRRAERAFAIDDVAAGTAAAREAIETARATEAPRIEALAYFALAGTSYLTDRDWTETRQHYEQALAVARTHGLYLIEAQILRQFGMGLSMQANPAAGKEALERAAYLQRELGNKIEQGRVLTALSVAHLSQGNLQEARQCCEQDLQLCQATGNRYDEAWAFETTCWIARRQGEYAEAKLFAERALSIFRQLDLENGECWSLLDLGRIHWYLGDYDAATVYLQRGLEINAGGFAWKRTALTCLGLISHRQGDDQAALEYGLGALSMVLSPERRTVLPLLGYASFGLGDLDRAADVYGEALTLWERMGLRALASEPLAGLAHITLCKGNQAEALAYVEEILGYLEDPAAIGEALDPFWVYLTCVRVLRANQDPRADEVLGQAYQRLRARAAKIEDQDLQRSYVENVPANREIVAGWVETSHPR
jgi:predicted ATPase